MIAETMHMVMPGDTNPYGTCFGGTILAWIDVTAGMAAQRFCSSDDTQMVTALVDSVEFKHPANVGDMVTVAARVNRMWKTSVEIGVKVTIETPGREATPTACRAYLTFVHVDNAGTPVDIPMPEALKEYMLGPQAGRRWDEAGERRERRLAARSRSK